MDADASSFARQAYLNTSRAKTAQKETISFSETRQSFYFIIFYSFRQKKGYPEKLGITLSFLCSALSYGSELELGTCRY